MYKGIPVAVKVMENKNSDAIVFKREVFLLSCVKHDNVVKFIGAALEPDPIILMELMEGGTLARYLKDVEPACLALQTALSFALQISQAMEALHANNIIHRDLKPENILLSNDKKTVKLADFGLARKGKGKDMTPGIGSYRYMAPEMMRASELSGYSDPRKEEKKRKKEKKKKEKRLQAGKMIKDDGCYDHKVDVYSFSLILWQLFTNTIPYADKVDCRHAAHSALEGIRPSLDGIEDDIAFEIKKMWERDPDGRPEFHSVTVSLSNLLTKYSKSKIRRAKKGKH